MKNATCHVEREHVARGLCQSCFDKQKPSVQLEQRAHLYVLQKNHRQRIRLKVLSYLLQHPCIDCGEADPIVLDFDHRQDKLKTISSMLSGHFGWSRILAEIEKCDVRCANCHRRKTYRERKYWGKTQAPVA